MMKSAHFNENTSDYARLKLIKVSDTDGSFYEQRDKVFIKFS